ncbi:TPA: hypothetical protein ACP32N_005022 [Pseudomonas aeruginosa]
MGQARQRGTLNERVAQSIAAKRKAAEDMGLTERSLDDIRGEFGLPPGTPFLGYLVHIPDSDEFLVRCHEGMDSASRVWTRDPGVAQRFEHFSDAYQLARQGREIVVGLFESESQFFVAEVL